MWKISQSLLYFLIHRFSPALWLHPDEPYYPSSVESYIRHSQLWCNHTLQTDFLELNHDNLHNHSRHFGSKNCVLQPQPTVRSGVAPAQLHNAPVYAYYKQFDEFVEIRYIYFYGYNGAYNLLHFMSYIDVNYGAHYADFEHITLRFARNSHNGKIRLTKLYFGAHTTVEGVWKKPHEVEWHGTKPVAYVAFGGHGNYPHVGVYLRVFGFGNDYCQRGQLWTPRVIILNGLNVTWTTYRGRFANRGDEIATLYSKTTGDPKPETNRSTSFLQRLFYLYPDNLK
jgi:hypothetical protein